MTTVEHARRARNIGLAPLTVWALVLAAAVALDFYRGPAPARSAVIGGDVEDRGHAASTPSEVPAAGWKDILWRVYDGISEHRVLALAAGVTFYSLLALFPAIAALVALYSLFADPATIRSHLDSLSGLLPAGAISVMGEQISRVAAQGRTTLGFASLAGLAISLWSANAGMKAIFDALNFVYQEREKRGLITLNAVSLTFTLLGILLVLAAIAAMVVLPPALEYLNIASQKEQLVRILRWPLLLIVVSFAISVVYRYGPSRDEPRWRWISWGSVFAAVSWLAVSLLFSWYAENFGRYNETYGSLGAAIGFMMWMWLSNVVLLVGAELNAEIEHQTARDTTVGQPRPMSARGAAMADTLGRTNG